MVKRIKYLLRDLRVLWLVKAFRGLVPVRSYALACQFNLVLVFFNNFTQTKVSDFYLAIVKDYILRLQVVVDDFLFLIIQVLKAWKDLRDY